ncbi:MAG: SDR family oxidoreductase [Pseudorhodoplanes sp.]|nr:SDR family oxidoreductase [Pseudorhodoplanes sp.]
MDSADDRPVAFVSAAAGGAGRTIAIRLMDAGYRVVACDIDAAAVESLGRYGDAVAARVCDMSDADAVAEQFRAVTAAFGRLDLLVNNVGIAGPTAAAEDVSLADWDRTMRTNVTSHFLCSRLAIPLMKARRSGAIVNISSASVKVGLPLRLPYVVSKSALLGLTTNPARELGPFGIRVNAILPGAIEGERLDRIVNSKARALGMAPEAYRAELLKFISLRSTVSPDDIAAAILFLASDAGRRITGQCIGVDGNLEYEA